MEQTPHSPLVGTDSIYNQKITQAAKDADDKQYYKDQLDLLDSRAFTRTNNFSSNNISEYKRKKVNYELMNNKLDLADFSYVCQPFGAEAGELPAQMANRDIVSGKIKAVLGTEAKRPFPWKIIAVNEDATTRREQAQFDKVKQFVVAQIMTPIQQNIEMQYQAQIKGKQLTDDEQKQIQQQIQEELQQQTPPEVMKYMAREYQDPAEALASQIMRYLMQKEKIEDKFLKGFKHACLSGEEAYWVGLINNEPVVKVINSLYLDYGRTPDSEFIEDSEWAAIELRMLPSQVVSQFRTQLEDWQIDELYENYPLGSPTKLYPVDQFFLFNDRPYDGTIRVLYAQWKAQRKIGFLNVINEQGELDTIIVNEDYKLNKSQGDVEIEWQWIPEVHHGYKIGSDIYLGLGPVPGQHKDLDNLDECKLTIIGAAYDDMNANPTSYMDRMKAYQYYYNIVMYRIELLMASDKGKILMMNINALPKQAGIDLTKFQYFLEANKIAYYDPNNEQFKGGKSIGEIAQSIDMSLVSDISKYIEIAEYIEKRCGQSVGITPEIEGQIQPNDAVRNAQSNLLQSANVLEPTFNLHNQVKRNVLDALIEMAKVGYCTGKPRKLQYVLDDLSVELINLDENNQQLLDNSTLGLFVGDASADNDAKVAVQQLAHAAMQNQQIDLLDVVKVLRANDVQEAEENLEQAVQKQQQNQNAMEQQKLQQQQQADELQRAHEREEWQHEKDLITLKAKEDRQTKVEVATIGAMAFDPNKDENANNEPDVLEVAEHGLKTHIEMRKIALEEKKADQNYDIQNRQIDVDKQKIAADKQKNNAKKTAK